MRKIKSKTIILFVVILAALISLIGLFYFYFSLSEILTEKSLNHLLTAAESRANQVETFLNGKKEVAIEFSSDTVIIDYLNLLKEEESSAQITNDLSWYLLLNKLTTHSDIYEIHVLDVYGTVIADSDPKRTDLGYSFADDLIFLEGIRKPFVSDVFYDEGFKKNAFAISVPVNPRGKFLGVIVIKMELETLFDITTDRTGLGETGEIYIINKESYLLTPSRFLKGENKGILTQKIDTENSRNCLNMTTVKHSDHLPFSSFLDYTGEYALGVHAPLKDMQWCLLAEMEKSEALSAPKKKLLIVSLFILFAMSLLYALIVYSSGKLLDRRIK